jgi:hypothetical protein
MSTKKKDQSQEIRNFVAKHMHEVGCTPKIVEDQKAKAKRGQGSNSFNPSSLRKNDM